MDIPPRLAPLLEQYDWGCLRLINRMTGPEVDSGNGSPVPVSPLTTAEYLWEPVPGAWSVRRHAEGPGPRATWLVGGGDWGRDGYRDAEPYPPPFTTIAWRLSHLSEMLALRADHTAGSRSLTKDGYVTNGDADGAVAAFAQAVEAWRDALLSCDDAALDTVGYSSYPYGSDAGDMFIDIVWWVNQEVLHHGGEIALLRDLYRTQQP
ncbi:DinB family protein [Trebonia kvetii]|uniref:DinB family protein n=1 Tax=Trebonia kvetii TaxID=2480626 RepID=A0A6P2C1L0_9ACTN|nr:DinB family protein [Trebonia kvetii]TVZ04375.1 DinB family protein [Trebonia kvetii]